MFLREDHCPAGVELSHWQQSVNHWEEPEVSMTAAWAMDVDGREDGGGESDIEGSGDGSRDRDEDRNSYEHSDNSEGEYDFENIYSHGQGGGGQTDGAGAGDLRSSRQDMFADRAARTAILGMQSGECVFFFFFLCCDQLGLDCCFLSFQM